MKKGISIWSFPSNMDIKSSMELAKIAGFDGIELSLDETGEISLETSQVQAEEYVKLSQELGIEILGLATGLYWKYSFTSNDPEKRAMAKKIATKQIELASFLGADTILVVPGAVGVDFIPDCEIIDYDIAYDRALEAITELSVFAEKKKINIGIENVWNKFLLSPLEMRNFIDKIGSNYVGAYLDVGNTVYCGYPEHWIKILGSRIKKIHFKDYRREVGTVNGFVDLLAGDVNYPAVMDRLSEIGYTDYVTAEMIPPVPFYKHHPDQIIWNTSASMDRILGG